MKPPETLQRLLDAYTEKAALRGRHVAAAAVTGPYDLNNTYQYVIAREDEHLSWLADAITAAGGMVPVQSPPEALARLKGEEEQSRFASSEADSLEGFVASWRPRVAELTNARHKLMLQLMLGEMLEQARFFRQAATGELDLLGRRTGGARMPGSVLSTRWVE